MIKHLAECDFCKKEELLIGFNKELIPLGWFKLEETINYSIHPMGIPNLHKNNLYFCGKQCLSDKLNNKSNLSKV